MILYRRILLSFSSYHKALLQSEQKFCTSQIMKYVKYFSKERNAKTFSLRTKSKKSGKIFVDRIKTKTK